MPGFNTRLRKRNSLGAVAVEAALVTPLFLLLVFGILEFGLLFKDWLAVSSSVRAGTRMASAEPRVATFGADAVAQVAREASALNMGAIEELWVYNAELDGTPVGGGGTFDSCSECIKYTWDASTSAFVEQGGATWAHTNQNACQGDPNRDSVGVYMEIKHSSITGLIFKDLTLSEHTVMGLEPIPATQGCKP